MSTLFRHPSRWIACGHDHDCQSLSGYAGAGPGLQPPIALIARQHQAGPVPCHGTDAWNMSEREDHDAVTVMAGPDSDKAPSATDRVTPEVSVT